MNISDNLACVAKVVSTHGLCGAVKVHSFMSDAEVFASGIEAKIGEDDTVYEVYLAHYITPDYWVFKINGITSIEDAQCFVGKEIYIGKTAFEETKEEEFFFFDLVNSEVLLADSGVVHGHVIAVHNFGSCDLVEVLDKKTNKKVMYPFLKSVFKNIDVENKKIYICDEEVE